MCHQARVSHFGFASQLPVVQARIQATQLGQGWGSSSEGLGAACLVPPAQLEKKFGEWLREAGRQMC